MNNDGIVAVLAEGLDLASAAPAAGLLLDAAPLSTNDLIEKLNTNILPKIRQQITDLSRTADSNQATEDLKKQLQVGLRLVAAFSLQIFMLPGKGGGGGPVQAVQCSTDPFLSS